MEKTFTPLAGQSRQEREAAALEDQFTFDSAVAAQKYQTWSQFLNEHYTYRGVCSDVAHRARYEALRERALYNLHSGNKQKLSPAAEVEAIRSQRRAEYERKNMERRYGELRDDFMQAAFNGKPWETVQRELLRDNASPWDHSLYQRACKEAGIKEPITPDQNERVFEQGFFMDGAIE